MRVDNDLEIRQSGRNEGPMVVVVDESFKSPKCKDRAQQVGDNVVANDEIIKRLVLSDGNGKRFGNDGRYLMRERYLFGKW